MRVQYALLLVMATVFANNNLVSAATASNQDKLPSELSADDLGNLERGTKGTRFLRKVEAHEGSRDIKNDDEVRAFQIDDMLAQWLKTGPKKVEDVAPKKMIEMVDMRKFDDVADKVKKVDVKKLDPRKVATTQGDDEIAKLSGYLDDLEKIIFRDWKAKKFTVEQVRASMQRDGADEKLIKMVPQWYKEVAKP
ncbi:hypothetical protein PHYPSEUDO_007859 [Phytophthora pseudosyringae]|uniref:RxLR effector protein n=1 Tax=Phytophthora pseudosyringae TaxID=221518 RepID=A0A8T1VFJ1_9STRA|nr:hypothetical protein PHYPSEUDO_007859 [Phytophthora pseudosyringae]